MIESHLPAKAAATSISIKSDSASRALLEGTPARTTTMPNFSGNWKIIRSENFEDLLKALGKEVSEHSGEARGSLESSEVER